MLPDYGWHDLLGNAGVVMILVAYWQLQRGTTHPDQWQYSALNGVGAALILVSLAVDFNLSAFVIEVCWLIISIYGLVKALKQKS